MDSVLLQQLAKKLQLTNFEPEDEPYILTPEDEEIVIRNAIEAKKNWYLWRLREKGLPAVEIDHKLGTTDWFEMIDKAEILKNANSMKNHDLWQKENRRKEKEEEVRKRKELQEMWSAKRMYQLMKWASKELLGKEFNLHSHNEFLVKALCFFVSRDERFETELNFSFKKGICIRGKAGVGKTHLVRCLENNPLNPILTLSMLEITDEVRTIGEYDPPIGSNRILYLDDVGTEEPLIKHYGTNITWFKNFIESIYIKQSHFSNLIISTNNSAAEIEERYGFRVRSRFKDMFNVIDVNGEDMRG